MTLPTLLFTDSDAVSDHAQRDHAQRDHAQSQSLAEERREVFESVLAALASEAPDADRWAAGGYLLCHLSRTAVPQPRAGLTRFALHAVEQQG